MNAFDLRQHIRDVTLQNDRAVLDRLLKAAPWTQAEREATHARAVKLVDGIRTRSKPSLMEVFLAEYGLSTEEGVALMCLAEALLRVPDTVTIDALIEDKIAPSEWGKHLGHSSSSLVNASTWALLLTGQVLKEDEDTGLAHVLRGAIRRLGEPVIRAAVDRAIRELGHQFVLGETIGDALKRGKSFAEKGYTFSFDMLGEAALTQADADAYFDAYSNAIAELVKRASGKDVAANPGISIKLSALHPRYETVKQARVMAELAPRILKLALQAKSACMGLNIDAEEADRLDISLDLIEAVLSDPSLAGWDGFGVVVQAYGKRAMPVIDWLHDLATRLDRKIMIRLVKGAYWDTEVKHAQVLGIAGYPVFATKPATDVSYLCCARHLLGLTDRIYPQFATHNAHSVAAILELGGGQPDTFEFQRLHGMGESLHDRVMKDSATRCRIYAPVGTHRDLLAYLVRRLLENGANSSFVNQIVDTSVPPEAVAADPFDAALTGASNLPLPEAIFGADRRNAQGWNPLDPVELQNITEARANFEDTIWNGAPILAIEPAPAAQQPVENPSAPDFSPGHIAFASEEDVARALDAAQPWTAPAKERAANLRKAADLYEASYAEFFALLAREAGKSIPDAIAELREAVDFLRYYANEAERLADRAPRGTFACISPWNFPLAIFTGQIAAALAAGNAVLAKPAETTSLVACRAVHLLHQAGIPRTALQLLPGDGGVVGQALSASPRVNGICFTGSTATAQRINRAMAATGDPSAPLIAETGGLNAMIVDSTALPEQAVRDIIASAFQSAGQRCSALRVLYVQTDIEASFLKMLTGAMDELVVGDPWDPATDLGPVIDAAAKRRIAAHVDAARAEGRLVKQLAVPSQGHFIGPALIRVSGIRDLEEEVFGPVLHVATFDPRKIDTVITDINASGYGLTFGLHTRIDTRVEDITSALDVGNIYVNRNQIGAVVGSQPFGGEGLSGTGPKAGGPDYVERFTKSDRATPAHSSDTAAKAKTVQQKLTNLAGARAQALTTMSLPGPTGESNRLSRYPRGTLLCLGPDKAAIDAQLKAAQEAGCPALSVADIDSSKVDLRGTLPAAALETLTGFEAVALFGTDEDLRPYRKALAARDGAILPLISEMDIAGRLILERHVCIDTTAAGGNAALLAGEV